jgi:hypothetical protein
MKTYGGSESIATPFLTSALNEEQGRFTPGEIFPGIHWVCGWVRLRACLDILEKEESFILAGN